MLMDRAMVEPAHKDHLIGVEGIAPLGTQQRLMTVPTAPTGHLGVAGLGLARPVPFGDLRDHLTATGHLSQFLGRHPPHRRPLHRNRAPKSNRSVGAISKHMASATTVDNFTSRASPVSNRDNDDWAIPAIAANSLLLYP